MSNEIIEDVPPLIEFESEALKPKKVPVTLLTGFLGSGKTTFLNYILTQNHGRKIAVIQNEFGEELGLERAFLMGKDEGKVQEWMELPNGCICCTVRDELVLTLEKLIEKRDRFDYIIIETTGMADPGPLATSLWLDEDLGSSIELDAIITIVDSKNLLYHLNDKKCDSETSNEAQKQIAFADLIIVNKTDLVTEHEVSSLIESIESINPFAPHHLTVRSVVPLDKVLDIGAFDPKNLEKQKLDEEHIHHHKHNKPSVSTYTLKHPGYCKSKQVVESWLGSLIWEEPMNIYRVKGELKLLNDEYRYIVQGVHDNFEIIRTNFKWGENLPQPTHTVRQKEEECVEENRLIFIGKNLNLEWMYESFEKNVIDK